MFQLPRRRTENDGSVCQQTERQYGKCNASQPILLRQTEDRLEKERVEQASDEGA